jgi:hypothetical protein
MRLKSFLALLFILQFLWRELVCESVTLLELVLRLLFDPSHPDPFAGKRLARASARAHASGRPVTSHESVTLHSPCACPGPVHTLPPTPAPRALSWRNG